MLQITRRMQSHWMKKQVSISLDHSFPLLPKFKIKGRHWAYIGSVYQHSLSLKEERPHQGPHDKDRSEKVTGALDLFWIIRQLSGISMEGNWYLPLEPTADPLSS